MDSSQSEPFNGPLLWVNHDAKNREARPHRKRVFTHIQARYRVFERESRAKTLRASVKLPVPKSQEVATVIPRTKPTTAKGKKGPQLSLAPSAPSLLKGNSDPFSAFAIEITPQVNELLAFYRDLFIPSVYRTGPDGWKSSKAANAEWRRRMDGLSDKGGALTFLARHAQIASVATNNPKLALEALSFTAKSTSVLRARLADDAALHSTVYWHISLLWGIEILMRNFRGALIHGQMLRSLLEKQQRVQGHVDLTMLRAVLYNDSHLLCMTLHPSVFDYDAWIPTVYAPLQAQAERDMPSLKASPQDGLDASIEGDLLRSIIAERRSHTQIWAQHPDLSVSVSSAVDAWLAVKCHIHIGRLVQHAHACMNEARRAPPARGVYLYAQACVALAALYWTRLVRAGFMMVCGVEIHDSQRTLLARLRDALCRAESLADRIGDDNNGSRSYRHAKLYALFTGAQAERTLRPERRSVHYGWFNTELWALSKAMGFSDFSPARDVLQGFLYVDRMQPQGSTWWGTSLDPLKPVAEKQKI